jgi:hypothetical protein
MTVLDSIFYLAFAGILSGILSAVPVVVMLVFCHGFLLSSLQNLNVAKVIV